MRASLLAALVAVLAGAALALPRMGAAQEPDADTARARLEELRTAIDELTAAQRREERRKGQLQSRLRETEEGIATLQGEARRTEAAIADLQSSIEDLSQRRRELNAAAQAQRDAVRGAVLSAYKRGDGGQLRLLLGDEDPQELARLLASYRYVVGARAKLIDEFRETLADLDGVEADLEAKRGRLTAERERQEAQLASLEKTRRERREVVARIDRDLASQSAEIAAREAERAELEELLEEIEAAAAALVPGGDVEPFTAAQGRMPWPVDGPVTLAFGRPRAQGKLRWQGVRMQADAGDPVRAIHHGRVVYADWLRGSGLLLVIDHGEGYMSLYAHNESLLREVGDWVATGTPVATVGDTGGQSEVGLYFEIRKDGRPTNPARWCRG